jgi:hypothetical protein
MSGSSDSVVRKLLTDNKRGDDELNKAHLHIAQRNRVTVTHG